MNSIKLNHWYINDNDLSISLMRYFVSIRLYIGEDETCVFLKISSDNKTLSILRFKSLEEAVSFTENVIEPSKNIQEIIEKYDQIKNEKVLKKVM